MGRRRTTVPNTHQSPFILFGPMWRTILLGKMAISIIASIVVGVVCIQRAGKEDFTLTQTTQWMSIGVFFCVLAIAQVGVIYFLQKKR